MVAPTFLFHDKAAAARTWLVAVAVAGEPVRLYVLTDGRRPKPEYDPRCGTPEDVYKESAYQKSARGWTPDAAVWGRLSQLTEKTVEVEVRGLATSPGEVPAAGAKALSSGRVAIKISGDPVGAPIFDQDVPLLPTRNEKGVIMPLAEGSLPLIEWRLRDLRQPAGVVVLKDMPTCANCHSFSNDGKYLGMDMDGPSGHKGAYAMAPVGPAMVIHNENVFTWNQYDPTRVTFGLFSHVSPDGRYVMSSVNESVFVQNYLEIEKPAASITSTIAEVVPASPPSEPREAIERMNTPGSPARSRMRTRSPRIAPPVNGLEGSTARIATRLPFSPAGGLRRVNASRLTSDTANTALSDDERKLCLTLGQRVADIARRLQQ